MYTIQTPFDSCLEAILTAHNQESEIQAAQKLIQIYQQILKEIDNDLSNKYNNRTQVDGGVAISSGSALDCLKDYLRTVRFINGVYKGLKDCLSAIERRPLQVVYAGCGPVAPLLLPMLHEFDQEELAITLIELNSDSLQSAKGIVEHLGLEAYFRDYQLANAITYEHPKQLGLDLVISETMDKGLTKEPQVRITQNLAHQLNPDGLFIPQEIELIAEHTFYGKEPHFDFYKKHSELPPLYNTADSQLLFTIDKYIHNKGPFTFESESRKVPEHYSQTTPDVAVYARVKIYEEHTLEKSESHITNPVCLISLNNINGEHYKLQYSTTDSPDWEVITI